MSRDPGLFLQDISEADADPGHGPAHLLHGLADAGCGHNLEVIGEAVKRLPNELKAPFPGIPWKRIAGFRDVLAHAYFSIDDSVVWDVAMHQMAPLLTAVTLMLAGLDS